MTLLAQRWSRLDHGVHATKYAGGEQCIEQLELGIRQLVSFACSWLEDDVRSQERNFFAEFARNLLRFNAVLQAADHTFPQYRIHERLVRAAETGVAALDTAASILLIDSSSDARLLSKELRRLKRDGSRKVWPTWLTYILDQLLNSHGPPVHVSVPPETTRKEWHRAEIAFGCIQFSDESFAELQRSIENAANAVDYAMECGGYPKLRRPAGRVRDLLEHFDSRALRWYSSPAKCLTSQPPPPAIQLITEPESLRRQLEELWAAAQYLLKSLDRWTNWFVELRQEGDADPAVALECHRLAGISIEVLLAHRPNVDPFDRTDESAMWAMLPPIPVWWSINDPKSNTTFGQPKRCWQEDRDFLDSYFSPPECRSDKAIRLRGSVVKLLDLLSAFPMAAVFQEADEPLGERAELVLIAMSESAALDSDHRLTAEQIASRALGKECDPNSLKGVMADLKTRDLVKSKTGRGGGCWLSQKGRMRAEKLRNRLGTD